MAGSQPINADIAKTKGKFATAEICILCVISND